KSVGRSKPLKLRLNMDPPTLAGHPGLTLRHRHQRCALETDNSGPIAVEVVHCIEIALYHLHPVEIDPIVLLLQLWLIFRSLRRRVRLLAQECCPGEPKCPNSPNPSSKHYNTQQLPVTIHLHDSPCKTLRTSTRTH